MPEFVGFQTMRILVRYGMTFDTVGVFGLVFNFYLNPAQHTVPSYRPTQLPPSLQLHTYAYSTKLKTNKKDIKCKIFKQKTQRIANSVSET